MHKARKTLRIGITMGDVNGIGPEFIIRAFQESHLREICTPVVYGSPRALNVYRKILHVDRFSYNVIQEPKQANPRKVSVIDCVNNLERVEAGKPGPEGGRAAFEALDRAVQDLKAGEIDALVTLPIDKNTIQNDNFRFPGHTEFLAKTFEVEDNLMFMVHEHLKVAVVTGHIPLKQVSAELTVPLIQNKIKMMIKSLRQDFNLEKPRIAVLGLNPHAGDNGLLGKEEKEKIARAVEIVQKEKGFVFGPYSADGFFASGAYKKFDGILAMYHDQGLIPFKLLAGFEGVNYTAGLPVVRTSPDHGLAYDLAGKGEADLTSFIYALYAAIDITHHRRESVSIEDGSIWNNRPDMNIRAMSKGKRRDRQDRGRSGNNEQSGNQKGRQNQQEKELPQGKPQEKPQTKSMEKPDSQAQTIPVIPIVGSGEEE
ncbi:MAG TPA: 4-hydroxythreonine-4-phosphate dehydrogenase PdxA [Bacteroidetes bacterium]|nr:4-hydroxythreonine-4-phosphate dehydrogenase PdxA [Bacteroidota bacterium]